MWFEQAGLDTTEISKLRSFLDDKQIPYEIRGWGMGEDEMWEGYNLHVQNGVVTNSFLLSRGSYGREKGLIEFYDFIEEPTGYLTANECIAIIKQRLQI